MCDEPKFKKLKLSDFESEVLRDKPAIIQSDDFLDKLYESIQEEEEPDTYNIVQITDWHIDFKYQEGANKNCLNEICCHFSNGIAEREADKARKYGELKCDLPYIAAEKQIEVLSKMNETIDLILWTGDSLSHDIFSTTAEEPMQIIANLSSLIRKYFPDVPVVPVLGNHDYYPVNYFDVNSDNNDFLIEIGESFRMLLDD